ncbi:MAG: transposase [Hyphomicrobiales bacterium]|nr:transposase [Hyphomicrobiales bacterium]
MSSQRFTPEFKEEAVRQVVERGYRVPDVAARLGVSAHSLYKWVKAVSPGRSEQQSKELLEAKSEVLGHVPGCGVGGGGHRVSR